MPSESAQNPVLAHEHVSDVPALFVADPFMLRVDQTYYLFFEVLNRRTARGEIGLATSENAIEWAYQQIVLKEPFHLSYPYVFEWQNQYYLIPESCETKSIRLYRAIDFPMRWSFVQTLLEGYEFVDSSFFAFQDKCWLFTGLGLPPNRADTLRLYYAEDLHAPWIEHRRSPIVAGNVHLARPAGRICVSDGEVIRYAQDCYPAYGSQVWAFEITDLTPETFSEREVNQRPILTGSGIGWNASGMHHLDLHWREDGRCIACVDGFMWRTFQG